MPDDAWGLETLTYRLSLGLLYPTLALLAVCTIQLVWVAGEVAQETWLRLRRRQPSLTRLRQVAAQSPPPLADLNALAADPNQAPAIRRFARQTAEELAHGSSSSRIRRIDHRLAQIESELTRGVNSLRVLVRVGPALGLAGTLIPLGPALLALGAGDLGTLSSQLVVAFSTTVIGLILGGGGYVLSVIRANGYDLIQNDLLLLRDAVCESSLRDSSGELASSTIPQPPENRDTNNTRSISESSDREVVR